jgi:transcriptional regulator with XRE-family HTH domain
LHFFDFFIILLKANPLKQFKMSDVNHILGLIREKRKEKGLTQADMAKFLGISQSAYKDVEVGRTDLKVKTLQEIADFLGIDIFVKKEDQLETSLIAINPIDIVNDIHNIKKSQEEMKNDLTSKMDKLLELFSAKGKKK